MVSKPKTMLVGGLEHEFHVSIQSGIFLSQLTDILFRRVETTNQLNIMINDEA